MVVVSASRIQLRKRRYALPFLVKGYRIGRELRRAPGFLKGRLVREGKGRFWTCTLWTDLASMERFRGRGHHLDSMQNHLDWTEELVHGNWEQEGDRFPGWAVLHEKLARTSKFTKLRYASDFQRGEAVPGIEDLSVLHGPVLLPKRPRD